MNYKKTAKDLAWDKERQKMKSEIHQLTMKCGQKEREIQLRNGQIAILENRITELEEIIQSISELSVEQLTAHYHRTKHLTDMLSTFHSMKGVLDAYD